MATKHENLNNILLALAKTVDGVDCSAIVSADGFIIASQLPPEISKEAIGAMSTAILSIGKRAADELNCGKLKKLYIDGEEGAFIVMMAGKRASLTVKIESAAALDAVFAQTKKATGEIARII